MKLKCYQLIVVLLIVSCSSDDNYSVNYDQERVPIEITENINYADANIGEEAKGLYSKLQEITLNGIAIGQQTANLGDRFRHKRLDPNTPGLKGDVDFKNVVGDEPAVVGYELEGIGYDYYNSYSFDLIRELLIASYEKGSVITISWHAINPLTHGDSFDTTEVVSMMLEEGIYREKFVRNLGRIANFFKSLKDKEGNMIPVLFRPWHEMNGDFFFWGEGKRSAEEFKQLYRETVTILSKELNVHNVLYVYSPNQVSNRAEYLRNYPGDDYVDLLGIDVYDFNNGQYLKKALTNLEIVEAIAREKNKLYAFTETGMDRLSKSDWWTSRFYKVIKSKSIAYALVWRNTSEDHFYVPYVGHPAEVDFKRFTENDLILLLEDIR
ncbi:glycoside hydrolase family 26 protein [Wenyingzhuangia sp. IMCC45574]